VPFGIVIDCTTNRPGLVSETAFGSVALTTVGGAAFAGVDDEGTVAPIAPTRTTNARKVARLMA
jgi:hypothetical protein